MTTKLKLTRSQILAYRRRVTALDERLPRGQRALRRAAWAGLQDSMPRAALLSIHARMQGTLPSTWEDPSLCHVWGPRFSTYVVAKRDVPIFTISRLPDDERSRARYQDIAARLSTALAGRRMLQVEAARAMGEKSANRLRYATLTGTVVIRWDGARQPDVWSVPAPDLTPLEARLELARRYMNVFGPATPNTFARWAGLDLKGGVAAFKKLDKILTQVQTPIGEAWILSRDEPEFRAKPTAAAPARLLPSGDTWFLLQGADRELLVPDKRQRGALWTSRVWPGALLVDGETAGTWRRAGHLVAIQPWRSFSKMQQIAIETEAASLPLPGIERPIEISWEARLR